ncbi:hypothetical protein AB0M87_04475 [Streptomyces sp. NPDC051320]|uniref:hypothetical protein n=1 Tax=Streptomyces sp. NPDC051320 TaxID=3154644 RepID=UPI003448E959
MDLPKDLVVKKFGYIVPVSAQQLLDAGLPLLPGMEPPAEPVRRPWQVRARFAWSQFVWNTRRRVGFWIADYTPDDEDW